MKAFWPIVWTIIGVIVLGEGYLFFSGRLTTLFSRTPAQAPAQANDHCAPDTDALTSGAFRAKQGDRRHAD